MTITVQLRHYEVLCSILQPVAGGLVAPEGDEGLDVGVGSLIVGAGAGEPDVGGGGAGHHQVLVGPVHPELEGGAEVPPVDQDAQVGVVHHGGGAHEQAAGRHHHLTANI